MKKYQGTHVKDTKSKKGRKIKILIAVIAALIAATVVLLLLYPQITVLLNKLPPNDPLYAEQGNLASIHIEDAWRAGLTGRDVKIAIIDTGVNAHEDLDMSKIRGKSYVDEDQTDISDVRGHGTFITGLLAATRDNETGIAGMTDSEIVILKVFGSEPHIGLDNVAQAIRDAVDVYQCSVINISMGTPNENNTLKEAVEYAISKGSIIIAAAGGDSETPYYPAAYDGVIGVDAVSADLELLETAVNNESVFVTAPGEKIVSLDFNGGYERNGAGASYAAAQVTALAAFAKQRQPDITPEAFTELLKQSVQDKGEQGYDPSYGWGVVDAGTLAQVIKAG